METTLSSLALISAMWARAATMTSASRRQLTLDPEEAFEYDPGVLAGEPTNNSDPLNRILVDAANAYWGLAIEDVQSQFFNKTGARQPSDNKFFKQHEFDWYGQDTWKIRSNFTLNLGLRYQYNGVPYETGGNLSNLLQDPGSFATGQTVTFSVVGPGSGHRSISQTIRTSSRASDSVGIHGKTTKLPSEADSVSFTIAPSGTSSVTSERIRRSRLHIVLFP